MAKRRDTIPITGRLDGQRHDVTEENVVADQGTGEYEAVLVTLQIPAPQFGNSPDSGRPPVEQFPRPIPAPGGRPDTTTPMDSARPAADADRGDRPSGDREQPCLGVRRGVVIDRCVQLPVTGVDPVTGPSPELAAALVLHRAHGGGVTKLGTDYLNHGLPAPGCLAWVLHELLDTGLLALTDPDPDGRQRVTLTTAGRTRYERIHGTPRPTGLPVPAPLFPTKTPAGRRLSSPAPHPAPGGQPDPHPRTGGSGGGPLRWARCPNDGRLHLLRPAEVVVAATGGRAEALCGRALAAEGLALSHDLAGALCLACLAEAGSHQQPTHPVLTTPGSC